MRAQQPTGSRRRRRGVVLILILAMLGLLALIGVTFATFSGQAKLGARYAAEAVNNPNPDQFIDFALNQLINDSSNPKSAIRGHSLLRDMYARDFFVDPVDSVTKAYQNHFLKARPDPDGQPLTVTAVGQTPTAANPQLPYIITTNIPTNNNTLIRQMPQLYGANFTGNVLRLQQWVLDGTNGRFTPIRQIQRADRIAQTFEIVADDSSGPFHVFKLSFADIHFPRTNAAPAPPLPQPGTTATVSTGTPNDVTAFVQPNSPAPTGYPVPSGATVANIFEIDGRYMHGFNGTGLGILPAVDDLGVARPYSAYPNFLYNRLNASNYPAGLNDPNGFPQQMDEDYDAADNENWFLALRSADNQVVIPSFHRPGNIIYNPTNTTGENDWVSTTLSSQSKFLRPRKKDHPLSGDTFPDLVPDAATGKITYDVDNDGDGVTDSVWVDLGYPVQRDSSGKQYKPLFAFMVTGLNGRLPLNTAGNLSQRCPFPQTFTNAVVGGTTYPTYVIPAGAMYRTQNADGTLSTIPGHASHLGTSANEINPEYALTPSTDPAPTGGKPYLQALLQGNPNVTPAIEGRWGEVGIINASQQLGLNPLRFPRAGRSYWPNDITVRYDEFDTDFNALDFYPRTSGGYSETNDLLDSASRTLLPVERLRRAVLPYDISGNGRMVAFDQTYTGPLDWGTGYDGQGRMGYHLYYRPPGIAPGTRTAAYSGGTPTFAEDGLDPTNYATNLINKLHGYEAARNPDGTNRDVMAGMPSDTGDPAAMPTPILPGLAMPSFSARINSNDPVFDPTTGQLDNTVNVGMLVDGSLGLSDASQMNLYERKAEDAAFTLPDQEALDRHGDIDDSGLALRMRQLLPDLFVNDTNAAKKRRLFSFETWDLNVASAPIGSLGPYFGFPNTNTTMSDGTTPVRMMQVASNPSLTHGGRRFNLNLPLPPSNLSDEPVRQKYVRELYQLMKSVLAPPDGAALTALQLAELGQFAVNVVDFRDTDATMTRFVNYDITYVDPLITAVAPPMGPPVNTITHPATVGKPTAANNTNPVIQWGMEFSPIAIDEILGYQFTRRNTTTSTDETTPRLFVELVNTLTKDRGTSGNGPASNLDLNGWGFVITQDDPSVPQPMDATTARVERPNVVTGQLSPDTINTFFVPLAGTGMGSTAVPAPLASTVKAMDTASAAASVKYYSMTNYIGGVNASTTTPAIESPLNGPGAVAPSFRVDARIGDDLIKQIPLASAAPPQVSRSEYYWLHLLRPANPNAGLDAAAANPSDPMAPATALAAEPKVVVDSFRFPYHVATGTITVVDANTTTVTRDNKAIYSVKRRQPYRGGHFIPRADTFSPPNAYGFTEQTFPSTNATTLTGNYVARSGGVNTAAPITGPIFHNLDATGSGTDNIDHFPFHDRDFQSLAELLLVPACPPGLFTKQFVELSDPTPYNPTATPLGDLPPPTADAPAVPSIGYYYTPPFLVTNPPTSSVYSSAPTWGGNVRGVRSIPDPPAFPYLAESFYYSSGTKSGWYKFLEFLEVPSSAMGYIGPVAAGQNADWARRDLRPGLLNLNLITDEEVLFGLIDDPRLNSLPVGAGGANFVDPSTTSANPVGVTGPPQMATAIYASGLPSYTITMNSPGFNGAGPPSSGAAGPGMKAAFADFLKFRDGGSGLIYSPFAQASQLWGDGATPANRVSLPAKPFRSLASADINDTVMRPARLQAFQALNNPGVYTDMGAYPGWTTPRAAPRRLFQIPDADPNVVFNLPSASAGPREDLASETGTGNYVVSPTPTAIPPGPPQDHTFLANTNASLFYNTPYGPPTPGTPQGYLGASTNPGDPMAMPVPIPAVVDHRWHPAYRTEMLSKVMNNTTVRTHQFAVWMTVGFFEVVKEGNPQMADVRYGPATTTPNVSAAVDQLGPELNAAAGKAIRYRSYFIIDRSRATGFNPTDPGDFRDLIQFRRRIE